MKENEQKIRAYSLRCPNCDAQIDFNGSDDLDVCYCQYCGYKILISGMTKEAYDARVKLKSLDHDEKMKEKELSYRKYKDKTDFLKILFSGNEIFMYVILVGVIFLMLGVSHVSIAMREAKEDSITESINKALQETDYDTAYFEANKLSSDKKENYLALIEERRAKNDINDPNNIFMPSSAKDYEGKNAKEIKTQLESIGFESVTIQSATDKASFFKKEGTIEHVIVGNRSDFTNEDYFLKDTPVIIYQYTK